MLSPITSQPGGSAERNPSQTGEVSPVSDALNLAASASFLRKDFATCQQIMTEKHQFLVAMLDSMNNKVMNIEEKVGMIEDHVQRLEENENLQLETAREIFQKANRRQNVLEKELQESAHTLNTMKSKCEQFDVLSSRMTQMENYLAQQHNSRQLQQPVTDTQTFSIAIYGLCESDDVTGSVQKLLDFMNLGHVRCISAHRTPRRHDQNRIGVVVAELSSLEDKQAVLERKRYLRNVPQYTHVFIKPAKSHTEQVMDSNFSVVLKEMSNGESYYIADNGRIQRKQNNRGGDYQRSGTGYGGARPKTSQYRGTGENR